MNHIFTWCQVYFELQVEFSEFELQSKASSKKIRVFALQVVLVSLSPSSQEEMEQIHVLLTQFKYFKWKSKMVIQLRLKGPY